MSTFLDKYKAFCDKDDNLTTFTSTSITGKGHGLLFSIFAGSTRSLKNISNEGITHVKAGCTDKTVRQGQFKAFCQVMLLGGYFSYDKDSDTYAMTRKGLCMERFSSFQPQLSSDDIFCLTLITLLDGKFRNPDGNEENTCFIRNVVRLIGICYNLSYSINDLLALCEKILSDKETQEPWKYTIFWLLSFYKSPEFLKEIRDCGFDDINEVVTYINENKTKKTFSDIVSRKFCSSGLYQRSTFMEDVEMVYVLTHVIKRIHTMNTPHELWNHIITVISYSRTVNKGEIIEFIGQNEDVFNNIFSALKSDPILSSFSAMFSMAKSNKQTNNMNTTFNYSKYLTALRTKPFLLLAGISGTGKSRIVREMARACWQPKDDEYKAHKPRNFEMVQVKPNWHDSSELIGYVSRIGEKPEFIAGDFLKFVAKAWSEPTVPYFLCLDEMNLAPVEQYFAEYLSVIESRKLENGKIVTDPLLKKEAQEWYLTLVSTLTNDENLHEQFLNEGISIPQNLFVVGTVNMDETTFSFSRKVLDRAMTIEMNEVDLNGGLEENAASEFGYIGPQDNGEPSVLIPFAVEGKDVYLANKDLCDKVIEYLQAVNIVLDKTPFKIAYRTRNEFLVYAVCRGEEYLNNTLDEMTSMKILSRIEGDADKTERVLNDLDNLLKKTFEGMEKSVSLAKIDEMREKLNRTQYTSFWS